MRAVRSNAPIAEVFDLSRELEYLVGQSEGVMILRGVAAHVGEKARVIRAPGATRKVVYLAGVPGSLVDSSSLLMKGLWARLAWKQAGFSTQSIRHLSAVENRLNSGRLVAVTLLLQDVLGGILHPFGKAVQGQLEPVAAASATQRVLGQLDTARKSIRRLRVMVRVMSLCRQHLHAGDIRLFFAAQSHCALRPASFPTFMSHVGGILGPERQFQGCELRAIVL